MIAVSIALAELDRRRACRESGGRELLSAISALQWGQDTGEVVVSHWTPLHSVWLAVAYPGHAWWLRDEGIIPGANLRGANLSGADLSGANLRGADLSGANLRGADLSGANLRGADLSRANLRGADLSWADLRGANLSGADLRGANLSGADLSGANLRGADLSRADLSWAYLRGADLSGADRWIDDSPIDGWAVRDGVMRRAS